MKKDLLKITARSVMKNAKIDLEFMKTKLLLSGDDQYNEIYKDILDVLNKHKRFKNI